MIVFLCCKKTVRGRRLDDRANFSWDWIEVISQPLTGWTILALHEDYTVDIFFFVVASFQSKINALSLCTCDYDDIKFASLRQAS